MPDEIPTEQAAAPDAPTGPPSFLDEVLPQDRSPVVSPDGSLGSVPNDKYDAALAAGYRFQTPDEQKAYYRKKKFGESPVKAFAAGAARALSLGASDAALPALGIAHTETLRGLKEENEGASTAGEVAALLLAPEESGPGALGKLGEVAEGAAAARGAGKVVAKAIAGGAEGMLWGASNAVDESVLGESDLNAEKLVASGGLGAVLGGAGGGIGGLLEEGTGLAAKALSRATADADGELGALAKYADQRAVKAIAGNGHVGAIRALDRKGMLEGLGRFAQDEGILTKFASAEEIAKRSEAAVEKHGARIGKALDELDQLATPEEKIDGVALAARIDKELIDPLRGGNVGDARIAKELEAEAQNVRARGVMGFREANEVKRSFDKFLGFGAEATPLQGAKRQLRGIVNDAIESQAENLASRVSAAQPEGKAYDMAQEFLNAKQSFGKSKEIQKLANERVLQLGQNRSFGLSDRLMGAALGLLKGGPVGALVGLAGAVGNKLARERGPQMMAAALRAVSDTPALSIVADALQSRIRQSAVTGALGRFAPQMMNAVALGPAETLLAHVHLAQTSPEYRAAAATAGLTPEDSPERSLDKAHALAVVHAELGKHDTTVERHLSKAIGPKKAEPRPQSHVLQKQDFGSRRQRKDEQAAHERHVDEVFALASNPQAIAGRVGRNMAGLSTHAPGIAAGMAATAQRAVQHLSRVAQRPMPAGPLAPAWVPGKAERQTFARHLEVAQRPHSVWRHIAAGTLTRDHVDALNAVYPRLAEHFKAVIAERLAEHPEMPYRARLGLGLLTGLDIDGTMGVAIAANQAALAEASQKPSAEMGGPAANGAAKLTLGERTKQAHPHEQREV